MPMPAYLTIHAERQGMITQGASTRESITTDAQMGHEDEIMVQAFSHSVITPRDPLSGGPTGVRIHQPFTFVCTLNKAVPLMYNALATGERLTSVDLKWYRTEGAEQAHFFTTRLEEALIVDIACDMPHCKDLNYKEFTQLVQVKMTYRKIVWEHVVAGTSGADDWRNPKTS